jgi:Polyketide cyclase / dehydrase and lipid transport
MKILIGIIIALAGIIVLLLIIGFFVKKDYSVGKEVVINKLKAAVFEYLKLLKNQNKFSVWGSMDPNMKTEFSGIDGTEGFVSAWESENKNVGKGEQEVLKIVDGERIDYEIRFIKPFKSTSWAFITTAALNDNKTLVHWEFTGKMKYPTNLMLLFMNMEKMVGNDLNKGLQNLKNILEK